MKKYKHVKYHYRKWIHSLTKHNSVFSHHLQFIITTSSCLTRLIVVYVTVCRYLWKSSIIYVVAQHNTQPSEHASESKIAFKVQHRKHPNMASQVLFQETCYLLLPLVPRTLPPLPLTLTLFSFFFSLSLITGSAPHLCPASLGLLPETRGPRVLCHHTLLVLSRVIAL